MLTYNDIFEALRKEKYSEQLQPLDKKFVLDVAEYLKEKKSISEKKEDMFSDATAQTKKQLENAVSIFRELLLRRKKKLLSLAFIARETGISKRDFENLLDFEKDMFDKIICSMEEADKMIAEILRGEKHVSSCKLVSFKDKVEEFLGVGGEVTGPFDKGEIANLPEEIAKILVESGKAEMIEE